VLKGKVLKRYVHWPPLSRSKADVIRKRDSGREAMLEIAGTAIASVLVLLGLVGCVLPTLPGPPVGFAGVFFLAWIRHFAPPLTAAVVIVMGILTLIVSGLDIIIPALGAKKYGTSKWGLWGSVIGMIIGVLFFSPLGMILGALIGAVLAEYLVQRQVKQAIKAGWGILVGVLIGTALKLGVCGMMTYYFVRALI